EKEKDTGFSKLFPGMMSDISDIVCLHIFIDGKEVCRKNYHYCTVGEHHMLMCDLRSLFNDEEWQGLDALCVGDDWKVVQIQIDSKLSLDCWGVCVLKQKTSTDDISFTLPNPNSSGGDYVPIPATSSLVPNGSPQMSGQRMRYLSENMNPRELYGEYLPLRELDETPSLPMALLRSFMIANVDIKGETSATAYGGSLKREHEESSSDVV
ncbi:NBS-containing resistance-like protein, partial [Trifolium medium]|nr:NBS-containing resistance-like protein [Trifolium medium]